MKYILLSLRSLWRFRTYTLINLIGLVLCLLCTFTLMRYIHQERSVNDFIPEVERLSLSYAYHPQRGKPWYAFMDKPITAPDMRTDVRIERTCDFMTSGSMPLKVDGIQHNANMLLVADSSFFDLIPFETKNGKYKMLHPDEIVLTSEYAQKVFGNQNPLGNIITYEKHQWTVVGVLERPSTLFAFDFDAIVCPAPNDRLSGSSYTLVQTQRAEDIEELNRQYTQASETERIYSPICYHLKPLKEIYLDTTIEKRGMMIAGNAGQLRLLTSITLLILFVGLFNYINLYSVVMMKRYKGLTVKKIFGASQSMLFAQLYLENLLLNGVTLMGVWGLSVWMNTMLTSAFGITILSNFAFDFALSAFVLFLLPLCTLAYTLFSLHRQPLALSMRPVAQSNGKLVPQLIFLLLQYVVTFCLIAGATYLSYHLYFLFKSDKGFQTENIIKCNFWVEPQTFDHEVMLQYARNMKDGMPVLKDELRKSPLITAYTFGFSPYGSFQTLPFYDKNGAEQRISFMYADNAYLKVFDIQLVEGDIWNAKDETSLDKVFVNETLLKTLGITDWRKEKLRRKGSFDMETDEFNPDVDTYYDIVGVIKDFKTGKLSDAYVPMMISNASDNYGSLFVSYIPGKQQETIAFLKALHERLTGVTELEYSFVEDEVTDLHEEDLFLLRVVIAFALVGIFISLMGLFGISLFDIRQRYKEIALRKINGAHPRHIFVLLIKKYMVLLVIAFAIGSALSYIAISNYVETMAYHAPIAFWIFLLAAGLVTLISLATIGWQVRKAVRLNPTEVIKSE